MTAGSLFALFCHSDRERERTRKNLGIRTPVSCGRTLPIARNYKVRFLESATVINKKKTLNNG